MAQGRGETGDLFRFFVAQQQYAAMLYLGKFVHPESGKTERNLEAARFTIDLLGMLEEKTRGNLAEDEERFLQQVLTNLRLNFVDEADRPPADEAKEPSETTSGPAEGEMGDRSAEAESPGTV